MIEWAMVIILYGESSIPDTRLRFPTEQSCLIAAKAVVEASQPPNRFFKPGNAICVKLGD